MTEGEANKILTLGIKYREHFPNKQNPRQTKREEEQKAQSLIYK